MSEGERADRAGGVRRWIAMADVFVGPGIAARTNGPDPNL